MDSQLPRGMGDVAVGLTQGALDDLTLQDSLGLLELYILGEDLAKIRERLVIALFGKQLAAQIKINFRTQLVAALDR